MKRFEILISLCMDMVCVFRRKEQVDMICLIERAIVENVNCKTLKKRNDSNMNSFIPQTFLLLWIQNMSLKMLFIILQTW